VVRWGEAGLRSEANPLWSRSSLSLRYCRINATNPRQKHRAKWPCVPPRDLGIMEEVIERTLRERRSLEAALADILTKHARIPSGQERSLLEQMISVLTHEIALRKNPRGDRNDVAV